MILVNTTTNAVIAQRVELASTFRQRLQGLMGRRAMPPDSALVLYPCSAVHTCFMRFPIDVVFLNHEGYVLKVVPELPPFRFTGPVKGSKLVVEMPAGQAAAAAIKLNDKLKFGLRNEALFNED